MRRLILMMGVFALFFWAGTALAQPASDLQPHPVTREQTVIPAPTATQPTAQNPAAESPTITAEQFEREIHDLSAKVNTLEESLNKQIDKQKPATWPVWWWWIGFWGGIIWLFPWIFVGWQWTRYRFWGFGWPWPWWFWIPIIWFIPWLVIAWWWWLDWLFWWIWIWWIFPWVFWLFWWIIIFKEVLVWFWRKK